MTLDEAREILDGRAVLRADGTVVPLEYCSPCMGEHTPEDCLEGGVDEEGHFIRCDCPSCARAWRRYWR
jgi:hypothetical protein